MKARRTSIATRLREAFRLEPLEPRVLLSADPVLGAAQAVLAPTSNQDQLAQEAYGSGGSITQQTTQSSTEVVTQILRQTNQWRGMTEFAVDAATWFVGVLVALRMVVPHERPARDEGIGSWHELRVRSTVARRPVPPSVASAR